MEKRLKINRAMKIVFLFLLFAIGCTGQIPMTLDMDKSNSESPQNKRYRIFFESDFSDTIIVKYNNKIIFNDYVKTIRKYEVAKEFCTIEDIHLANRIILSINNKVYYFEPKKGYQYYYFFKINDKIGIEYSNVQREYY